MTYIVGNTSNVVRIRALVLVLRCIDCGHDLFRLRWREFRDPPERMRVYDVRCLRCGIEQLELDVRKERAA